MREGGNGLNIRRLLRSRFFVFAVLMILELAVLLTLFLRLYAYFMPFTVLAWLLQGTVFLYLVNREGIAELKIPWLIMVMLLPVLGAFLYMLFSGNKAGRREFTGYR